MGAVLRRLDQLLATVAVKARSARLRQLAAVRSRAAGGDRVLQVCAERDSRAVVQPLRTRPSHSRVSPRAPPGGTAEPQPRRGRSRPRPPPVPPRSMRSPARRMESGDRHRSGLETASWGGCSWRRATRSAGNVVIRWRSCSVVNSWTTTAPRGCWTPSRSRWRGGPTTLRSVRWANGGCGGDDRPRWRNGTPTVRRPMMATTDDPLAPAGGSSRWHGRTPRHRRGPSRPLSGSGRGGCGGWARCWHRRGGG